MFSNIGKKIMILAQTTCWVGIGVSIIGALVLCVLAIRIENIVFLAYGLLLLSFGSLFSWIGSFTLYGFGQLIDDTQENNEILWKIFLTTKKIKNNTEKEN